MAKILIIDDDAELSAAVSATLSRVGHRMMTAENGMKGAQRCRESPPDVAMVDMVMPYGGLATIHGFVGRQGGSICFEGETGCTFRVILPAAGKPHERLVPTNPAPESTRGALILLVDDDPPVREFTAAALQTHGYRVLQAGSMADALETWRWHGARIKLLITDVVLEGPSSGLDLAAQLRASAPALPVICMSGHDRKILARGPAVSACQFIAKPCRPQALARAVGALLAKS